MSITILFGYIIINNEFLQLNVLLENANSFVSKVGLAAPIIKISILLIIKVEET